MATSSSSTPSLVSLSIPSSSSQTITVDKQAAMEELARKARLTQLAAQLRLRLSYTGYKASNKLSSIPFATLEKRLEEEISTPKAPPAVLLLDPVSVNGDKSVTDTQRMPPPPAPTQSTYTSSPANSLYATIFDMEIPGRPAKRQKVDEHGGERAFGPSPAFFSENRTSASSSGSSVEKKRKSTPPSSQIAHKSPSKHRGSAQKLHKATLNASPRKKSSGKKQNRLQTKDVFAMEPSEQEAAETLVSFLMAQSPKPPSGSIKSSGSISSSNLTVGGVKGVNKKGMKRTASSLSMSSVDAAMADTTLSTSGMDTTAEGSGSGFDTVPGSPIPAAGQTVMQRDQEQVLAETLIMFSQSPSPARNPSRRGPIANVEGRVLFSEGSSTSEGSGAGVGDGKNNAVSKGLSGASLAGSATSGPSRAPSLLLPPPPSPTKKSSSNKVNESYAMHPFAVSFPPSANPTSGQPQLQAPFTPGPGGAYFNPSAAFNPSNPFPPGFAIGISGMTPSTPQGLAFNMGDFIHLTPTPGGLSPAPRGSVKGGTQAMQGMQMQMGGPGMPLMQSIFAGGYGGSPGLGLMAPVMAPSPKKEGERKRKKASGTATSTASSGTTGDRKTPGSSSSASQTPVASSVTPKPGSEVPKDGTSARTSLDVPKITTSNAIDESVADKKSNEVQMETGK